MSKEEAVEILKLYRNWNESQKSISLAFRGVRTPEDDLLDERRALIRKAMKVLTEDK